MHDGIHLRVDGQSRLHVLPLSERVRKGRVIVAVGNLALVVGVAFELPAAGQAAGPSLGLSNEGVLSHVRSVDLGPALVAASPASIGLKASAIAWTGEDLYVGGLSDQGSVPVGIVRVRNVLQNPQFGSSFGRQGVLNIDCGYTGLDFLRIGGAARVVAALDTAAVHPDGISCWDDSGNHLWSQSAQGTSGVAFDTWPQPPHAVAWTSIAGWTGRRALNRHTDGSVMYSLSNGAIVSVGQLYLRSIAHDPATSDIWLRESNFVTRFDRIAVNGGLSEVVVFEPIAQHVIGQNIEVLDASDSTFVIYNDREIESSGQAFLAVVKVIRTDGTPVNLRFDYMPPDGNGYYDFAWDAGTGTLAILDPHNATVEIYKHYEPGQSFCTAKAGLACGVPIAGASGAASATAPSGFVVRAWPARGNRLGVLLYNASLGTPKSFAGGTLCVESTGVRRGGPTNSLGSASGCDGVFSIDMNAFARGTWSVPPSGATPSYTPAAFLSQPGQDVWCQYWGRDSVATGSFVSAGIRYVVGP